MSPILAVQASMETAGNMRQKRGIDQPLIARVSMRNFVVAAVFLLTVSGTATWPAEAQTLEVLGQAGMLGEWELTANITTAGPWKQFAGPLVMKHVGICTQDGPEIKKGEIQLQLIGSSLVRATLLVEGVTCTYAGRKSDSYNGVLRCPDKRDVPLVMWLR